MEGVAAGRRRKHCSCWHCGWTQGTGVGHIAHHRPLGEVPSPASLATAAQLSCQRPRPAEFGNRLHRVISSGLCYAPNLEDGSDCCRLKRPRTMPRSFPTLLFQGFEVRSNCEPQCFSFLEEDCKTLNSKMLSLGLLAILGMGISNKRCYILSVF